MKILLRQMQNNRFLISQDQMIQWTLDKHQATPFATIEAAEALCSEKNLKDVEALFMYGIGGELALPLPPVEEKQRQVMA